MYLTVRQERAKEKSITQQCGVALEKQSAVDKIAIACAPMNTSSNSMIV